MAAEQITVGEYKFLKFILLVVVAVIVGNIITQVAEEKIHQYRRAAYLKKNPQAMVNQPATMQQPAAALSIPAQPQSQLASGPGSTLDLTADGSQWQDWS